MSSRYDTARPTRPPHPPGDDLADARCPNRHVPVVPDHLESEVQQSPPLEPASSDVRRRRRTRARSLARGYFWLAAVPLAVAVVCLYEPLDDLPAFALGPYDAGLVDAIMIGQAACALAALLLLGRFPRRVLAHVAVYAGFLLWAIANSVWTRPYPVAALHFSAFAAVGCWVLLAGCLAANDPTRTERVLDNGFRVVDVVAWVVALYQIGHGFWTPPFHAFTVHPRLFAMTAIAPVAWHLSRWFYGHSRAIIPVVLWAAAVFLTYSRLATGTIIVLLLATGTLSYVAPRFAAVGQRAPSPRVLAAIVAALGVAVVSVAAFYNRLFVRDPEADTVAGVNFTGRLEMWRATLASGAGSPIVGKGMGANQVLLEQLNRFGPEIHPHNEYIRIWHDLGLIGLTLFVWAMVGWLRLVSGTQPPTEDEAARPRLQLAAWLALIGVLCLCTAEQPFVQPGIVGSFAVVVGAGIGAAAMRDGAAHPTTPSDERLGRRSRRRRTRSAVARPVSDAA